VMGGGWVCFGGLGTDQFAGAVTMGKLSVRKGEAGRPSTL
jgi:hypothetical protein